MYWGRVTPIAAFLLLWSLCGSGGATTVERLTLQGAASRAARIVEIKIREASPARDLRGRPATRVCAAVLNVYKGERTAELEWLSPGGTAGGETLVIPGLPQFTPGEEMFIFLSEPSSAGLRVPIGLGQGVFRLQTNPNTKKTTARADYCGLTVVDAATGRPVREAPAEWDRADLAREIERFAGK